MTGHTPEHGADEHGADEQTNAAPDAPTASMRVVTGSPTEVELAAVHSVLVAVLAEQAARGAELIDPPVDRWKQSARAMRGPISPGVGAWRGGSEGATGDLRGY